MTLLHEAGHAFHAFAAHAQPLIWQRHPGSEAAELASMSMELLAAPHLARPVGFFSEDDHLRAWLEHLEDILLSLAHIASVDAFQTWIYTSGEGARRGGARRGVAPHPFALRARSGLVGARAGAHRAMVPPAPHLSVSVLLHRVRHRADRRAPGMAEQPARSGRRGGALPRRRWPSAPCTDCRTSTARPVPRSASMSASSGSW